MNNLSVIDWTALAVLIIGGINWGMISAFNIDLVSTLFGEMTVLARTVYALVGLSAVYMIFAALYELSASDVTRTVNP